MGAGARPTDADLSENLFVPPRVDNIWDVAFMARPFLAIGAFGLGMVSDASLSMRHPSNLRMQVLLEPLSLGYADEGNIIAMAGNVLGSYDTRVFEIGLGLGWSLVNEDLSRDVLATDEAAGRGVDAIESDIDEVKSGLSIAQIARLGATDGLHILLRNTFLLYDETFHYGGTVGQLQWPVSRESWLLLRGGGGSAGSFYGEVGLRWLARGNGDKDSLFLTVTAGGAGLSGQKDSTCTQYDWSTDPPVPSEVQCTEPIGYGGPMVGFGAEWRL